MKPSRTQTKKCNKPREASAEVSRRSFLSILWAALGIAALAEFLWLAFSFLWPSGPDSTETQADPAVLAGAVASFAPGSVAAFQKGQFYLVRLEDGGFLALSCKCTHLGCTVPWVEEENKFICPCHASAFDSTGNVISAPAPRALDIFPVSIENHIVKVDTGRMVKRGSFHPDQLVYPPKM